MVLSARQQYGDFLANPANKRARSEPSSSDSPAYAVGKGVAKITADWAGPKLGAVIVDQHKRAAQLRKSMQSNKEAIAKLQELSAQEKTPSSLTVKLAPAAQKMLPHLPAAAELIKQTEKAFIAEALRQREAGDIQDQADLSSITSGDQFDIDARAATHFDGLQPVEQALVEALIAETKEELLLTMRFSQIDVEEREERARGRPRPRGPQTRKPEPWRWISCPPALPSRAWLRRLWQHSWPRRWPSSASTPTRTRAGKCTLRAGSRAAATAAGEAALTARIVVSLGPSTEADPMAGSALPGEDPAVAAPNHAGDQPPRNHGDGSHPLPTASRGKTPGEAGELAPTGLQAPSTEEESEA